ncbi:MAG: MFS transporter [Verrucomicrobiae bacterium]|nr:MFS transporter [Verrucomicrobiae bacterium]
MSNDALHKTRTLWLVGALHAFTHLYYVALIPLYLLIQRDFQFASVGQATSLVTVQMVAYFLPSYALGVLADRVSRKKLLGYGLAINGLGYVALALSPNYACAVVAVILAGLGGSFYHPAATAMIARLYPVNTGRALGLIGAGASVGFFVGPLYSGWRAAALESVRGAAAWRTPILELGLLGIVAAGVFAWLAREEQPAPPVNIRDAARTPIFPTTVLWVWFFAAACAFSLRDFAGAGMGTMSSLFLQKAHGYDARLAGLALSVLFIVSAISNPLFGHLSDRGRKRWTASVTLVGASLMLVFPLVPGAWLIPCLAAYGFFFMSAYPMVEAELMQSVPDAVRGRVFGLFITVGGLVGNLSHWIVGTHVKRMGEAAQSVAAYQPLYAGIAALTVLSLLGLPCLHAIRKREHLQPPSPST